MSTILQEAAAGRATIVPWTVDQYHHAVRAGFLPTDASAELIDGVIIRKDRAAAGGDPMTIGDRHRVAVVRLSQLAPAFDHLGCFLQTQQPISLPPASEPEPDVSIIRGRIDDYLEGPPLATDVLAVVEVADSSLRLDSGPKLAFYASAGVPQYILVDLVNDRVLVHTAPAGAGYSQVVTIGRDAALQISAGSASVPVAAKLLLP